ncbi:hypothetical protein [Acinetobacter sp.]|uniref:hypothetical protein n=1 Tax=Acinetobacter sp. TaxID=472 RepID=UPI0035B2DC05
MQKEQSALELTQAAQQLLRISADFSHLVQAQQKLAAEITADQLFKMQQESCRIQIAHPCFYLQFNPPYFADAKKRTLLHSHFAYGEHKAEFLEDFVLHDIYFLTGDLKAQHPLFLRSKAEQLRTILAKEIFSAVSGLQQLKTALQHLSLTQARYIDELMMALSLYSQPVLQASKQQHRPISSETLQAFEMLFRLDVVQGQAFLPVQSVMDSFDEFCFSAAQFLDPAVYRIASLFYREQFTLHELIELEDDIALLYPHAKERPHLLGFARLMNRELWNSSDLFAKQHFYTANHRVWQKKAAALPVFDSSRTVNWLFKQPAEVLDWVSQNIQHGNIRNAVTTLSFIDCSQMHPQIILAALQYFQHVSARLFIHSCHAVALDENWFDHPSNHAAVLQGTKQAMDDHRIAIRPSILYLDEWMALAACIAQSDAQAMKKVYSRLSRVMQAFMQQLQKMSADLPEDLMAYILPEAQQNRDFYAVLQRHKLPQDAFRQAFYLQRGTVRKNIFDAYVRDYLSAYFSAVKQVPKTVTWTGLFHQAAEWHGSIQKEEILAKLKKEFSPSAWQPFCAAAELKFEQWRFQELQTLERIIEESLKQQNCLAASYAQRIAEEEYSAFHMTHSSQPLRMTLGCIRQHGQLIFDQLELSNNEKADEPSIQAAKQFIEWLNAKIYK